MKKTKSIFLVLSIFLVIFFSIITITTVNAAPQNVIYVSSDGKGTGATPSNPLGNSNNYKIEDGSHIDNAFYKALLKLKNTGGTIVIVGPTAIDTAEARVPKSKDESLYPAEFKCPTFLKGTKVKITSVYGGKDYRKNGAKLILDHDACNTSLLVFEGDTTLENIDIEYKYDSQSQNSLRIPFVLGGGLNEFVISNGVNVTSYNTHTQSEGELYPILIGGYRYASRTGNTSLTVKSGTWSCVIGGSFGLTSATKTYGEIDGNVNLKIEGGKIETVIGTGSFEQPSGSVTGNVNITVNGGEIKDVYACNQAIFKGNKINVIISGDSKVDSFDYAPANYFGELGELKNKVTYTNNTNYVPKEEPTLPDTQISPPISPSSPDETQPNSDSTLEYELLSSSFLISLSVLALSVIVAYVVIYFLKLRIMKK